MFASWEDEAIEGDNTSNGFAQVGNYPLAEGAGKVGNQGKDMEVGQFWVRGSNHDDGDDGDCDQAWRQEDSIVDYIDQWGRKQAQWARNKEALPQKGESVHQGLELAAQMGKLGWST